jgi:hypothetical protein
MNSKPTYCPRAMCPSEMAAYHGTAVGHIRLLRCVLFGVPAGNHPLKHRRLSFVPILCALVFARVPCLVNAQDIAPDSSSKRTH